MFGRKAIDAAFPDALPPLPAAPPAVASAPTPAMARLAAADSFAANRPVVSDSIMAQIRMRLFERIDVSAAVVTPRAKLIEEVTRIVGEIATSDVLPISAVEQRGIAQRLLDDMIGVGPLEPFLADDAVADIMVNGPYQIYVERAGRLELTEARFRGPQHVISVAQRIAASVGRRVDETSPTCDARLADGSRVNIVLPPIAIDGACISIRKFAKRSLDLAAMTRIGSLSPSMAKVLEIAGASRLNIVISGGTGSGKTTLLNALSRLIDGRERIVTIEDAAELQLQQSHVVRLETRTTNTEGSGEINQRDLVRNALRMRPDRIILGETRGAEAFDVLQAMNTGHDGSMTTIHANTPRDAVTRLENMVLMANANLPLRAVRNQIASAVNLIVQVARMRDGVRRIQAITEVVGLEGDTLTLQDLFTYEIDTRDFGEKVSGAFKSFGLRPHFLPRASYFGLDDALLTATR
jgi:pilus assembly protein CpaF